CSSALQLPAGPRRPARPGTSPTPAAPSPSRPRPRALLAAGCGLALPPRVFRPGQCAQTLFARMPIILDQTGADPPQYRLLVRRSYARWLAAWLIDAAAGLG